MKKAVGFDQKILLHHMDFIAREIPRTEKLQDLYEKVDQFLTADIAGAKARLNARTILFKIWVHVAQEYESLRAEALEITNHIPQSERKAVHWGMTLLAYPFFADLVTDLGSLFKIQQEVPSAQISRMMKARYGDRRRVEVSISATLTTLREWGMMISPKKAVQTPPSERIPIHNAALKQWLCEVLLRVAEVSALPIEQFRDHPLLFPFQIEMASEEFDRERFHVIRQGVNQRVVALHA